MEFLLYTFILTGSLFFFGCKSTKNGISFMAKPKIYQIKEIDSTKSPCHFPVIIDDFNCPPIKRCECGNWTNDNLYDSVLIQGYDDFLDVDLSKPVFLGYDITPLFATWKNSKILEKELSGCRAIPVGYDVWEQEAIPKKDFFARKPKLGAVFVVSKLNSLYNKKGALLEKCPICGTMGTTKNHRRNEKYNIKNIRLDYDSWDGDDIFYIEFGVKSRMLIITEAGIDKLKKLGFDNLIYEEVFWYDPKAKKSFLFW
jgi:hypothetical protein